jgi:LuxR family maltose regulon positive regulatory protein
VLRLLAAHHVELYDSGREATIRETLAQLAPETTEADLATLLDLGWCQLLVSRAAFLDCVDQAEWWVANREVADEALLTKLDTLASISCLIRGDWTTASERARRGLSRLDAWWEDPIGRTAWNNVGRAIALSERWHDTSDEVRELSVTLRREPNRLVVLEATRALGDAMAGRPVDALRIAAGVRTSAALANLVMSRAELALAEAIAHRELADNAAVADEFATLVALPVEPMSYVRAIAALEAVQLHLDLGDVPGATSALATLEALVRAEVSSEGGRTLLGRMATALHLATGDLEAAASSAHDVEDPFWGPAGVAHVHLANGDRSAASNALDVAVPRSSRHEVILAIRRARACEDHDAAAMWAGRAVTQACADGMLQTVASENCLTLIEQAAWRVPAAWMDRLRRLTAATRQPGLPSTLHLVEPLTARERDVLRFLPSRLTLGEIADELYVSVNTLKFHLKLIYRKLGVNSRAEAAEFARSWTRGRGQEG